MVKIGNALVYIAAFAPDQGETAGGIEAMNPGSQAAGSALTPRPYPGGTDVYIMPKDFRRVFCADLPPNQAALMAATQRPLGPRRSRSPQASPLGRRSRRGTWSPPKTTTVTVKCSHVATLSHPAR